MQSNPNTHIRNLVNTGMFAALICVTTAFIMHIPVGNGYIHLGDGIIYLAACMLPAPYGIFAAALGGGMADLLCGYTAYVLPTMIIKSLLAVCFYAMGKKKSLFCAKTVIASVLCLFVTVIGYYITAVILYGNPEAQLAATIPGNAIQGIGSAVLFGVSAFALDRVKLPSMRH